MQTLNDLDLFCTEENFNDVRKEVVAKLRDMGLSNLSSLVKELWFKAEEHGDHVDTILTHFHCDDVKELADMCDDNEVGNTEGWDSVLSHFGCVDISDLQQKCDYGEVGDYEGYIHEDCIWDYIDEYVGPKIGAFTSSMEKEFEDILEDPDYTREKLGHYILNEDAISTIKSRFHDCLSNEGLE